MSDFGPALTDDQWNRIRQIARRPAGFAPMGGVLWLAKSVRLAQLYDLAEGRHSP